VPFPLNPSEVIQWLRPLLKVFNLDKLNYNDPQTGGDGFFDFVQGITVDSQNGRLILQLKNHLENYYFLNYPTRDQEKTTTMQYLNQKKYVYRNMYRNTQSGALQDIDKINFY
jgi:cell surface protein SprA